MKMSEKVVKHADETTPQPPESRAGHFVSIDDYTAEDMQEGQAFKVETTAPDRDVLQAGVPVEKPGKHRWIQTHPDDEHWLRHWSFVLKTGMEERWHPFPAQAADVVPEDLQVNMLFVFSMDLQGNAF